MRTRSLFLLLSLLPASALARPVADHELVGLFDLRPARTSPAGLPRAVELLAVDGALTLELNGSRVALSRQGDELAGDLSPAAGFAGALDGEAAPRRLRLRVIDADALEGEIDGSQGQRFSLRRRSQPAPEALLEKARRFLVGNACTEAHDDRPLPPVDSGNSGLHAWLLSRRAGERLLALARAWDPEDEELAQLRVDHRQQVVLAVLATDDDQVLQVAVMDASGRGRLVGPAMSEPDYPLLEQSTLDGILPGLAIDEITHGPVLDRLNGQALDLSHEGFALRSFGAPGREVRFFASRQRWEAREADPPAWVYVQDEDEETVTYGLGEGATRVRVVRLTKATGELETLGRP